MKNLNNMCLLGDVARILGVVPYRIVYLLTSGKVPEPVKLGGRRVFFEDDIERIAKQLKIENWNLNDTLLTTALEQRTLDALNHLGLGPETQPTETGK